MDSPAPAPPDDLQPQDDGSLWITLAAAISGVAAGWAAIRGVRRLRDRNALREPAPPAPSATVTGDASPDALGATTSSADLDSLFQDPPSRDSVYVSSGLSSGARLDTVWSRPTKYLVATGLVISGFLALFWMRGILPILIIAGLMGLIIQPLIEWFQTRLRLPHRLSMALAYVVILLLVLAIPLIVLPTVWDAAQEIQTVDAAAVYARAGESLNRVQAAAQSIPLFGPAAAQSLQPLQTMLESAAAGEPVNILPSTSTIVDTSRLALATIGRVTGAITPLISWVLAASFAFLISVYLSSGRYSLRAFLLDKAPPAYVPEFSTLMDRISWTWGSFLRGQLKLMLLIGLAVMVGNAVLGNRYAAMLGLISGVLEVIPSIGPALALIPGVLVALIFGSSWMGVSNLVFAIIVLAFYLLVQVLENHFVVPRVLGDAVELPPPVVLVGVLIGGSLGGILGALIAVPVIGTAREVVGYLYGKIIEAPAIEAPPELEPNLLQDMMRGARNLRDRVFKTRS